jgi:hypothetical protein
LEPSYEPHEPCDGALFGVRVGFMDDGRLVTGFGFIERVDRTGTRTPDGSYAQVGAGPLELTWAKVAETGLAGAARATGQPLTVVVEAYSPHDYPGRFCFEGHRAIVGNSPRVETTAGTTKITGGVAMVEGRSMKPRGTEEGNEGFWLRFFSSPSISGTCSSLAEVATALAEERVSSEVTAPVAFAVFELLAGQSLFFVAGLELSTIKAPENLAQLALSLEKSASDLERRRVAGGGRLGGALVPMLDELFWILTYHPYLPFFRNQYADGLLVRGNAVADGASQGNWEVGKGMDDTPMRDLEGPELYSLDGSCQKAWNLEGGIARALPASYGSERM